MKYKTSQLKGWVIIGVLVLALVFAYVRGSHKDTADPNAGPSATCQQYGNC